MTTQVLPRQQGMISSASTPRRGLVVCIKVVISALLLTIVLRSANLGEIWAAVRGADLLLLVVAFSLHLVGFMVSAYRWRMLLRTSGADCSIRFLFESYIVGVFFSNFLPSTIGGDVYRAYDSSRLGQGKSNAIAVVVLDRFLGLLSLMLFALLALLAGNQLTERIPLLFVWVSLGTLGILAFVWVSFMPPHWLPQVISKLKVPFGDKVRRLLEAFLEFKGHRAVLVKALGLSLLLQANVVLHYYLIAQAMNLAIPLSNFFLIIPVATLIMMLPISVNGIGLRENVFVFFFAPFAIAQSQAIAFPWIAYGMVVVLGVAGGVLYVLRK